MSLYVSCHPISKGQLLVNSLVRPTVAHEVADAVIFRIDKARTLVKKNPYGAPPPPVLSLSL